MTIGKGPARIAGAAILALALAGCDGGVSVERGNIDYEQFTAQQIFERVASNASAATRPSSCTIRWASPST